MLKLIDNGPEDSIIEFRPRLKAKGPIVTRSLVYGHHCKWCGNIIQAMFLTDEEIRLFPYEETRVISQGDKNDGTLLKIVPNVNDRDSAYRVDMYRTKQGTGQMIRLKNHMIRWDGISSGNPDLFFEVGERCCKYIGTYTRDSAEIINEIAAACGYNRSMYDRNKVKVNIPLSFLGEWNPSYSWNRIDYELVPPIGKGNTMMMVPRLYLKSPIGSGVSGFMDLYDAWDKKLAFDNGKEATDQF